MTAAEFGQLRGLCCAGIGFLLFWYCGPRPACLPKKAHPIFPVRTCETAHLYLRACAPGKLLRKSS